MIPYDKYLVWRCPKCKTWQGRLNNKWSPGMSEYGKLLAVQNMIMKCLICRANTKFKDNEKGGSRVSHFWYNSPSEATRKVQELKGGSIYVKTY